MQEQHNDGNRQPQNSEKQPQHCYHEPNNCTVTPQPTPKGVIPKGSSVEGFLRQLLPKDFDTGDLLVILLLLLMSGESKESQNTALLTLALYLFM